MPSSTLGSLRTMLLAQVTVTHFLFVLFFFFKVMLDLLFQTGNFHCGFRCYSHFTWLVDVCYLHIQNVSTVSVMRTVCDWSHMKMTVFITLLQCREKSQVIFISKHISA